MQDRPYTRIMIEGDLFKQIPRRLFLRLIAQLSLRDLVMLMLTSRYHYGVIKSALNKKIYDQLLLLNKGVGDYQPLKNYMSTYQSEVQTHLYSDRKLSRRFWRKHQKAIVSLIESREIPDNHRIGDKDFYHYAIQYNCDKLLDFLLLRSQGQYLLTRLPATLIQKSRVRLILFKYPHVILDPVVFDGIGPNHRELMVAGINYIKAHCKYFLQASLSRYLPIIERFTRYAFDTNDVQLFKHIVESKLRHVLIPTFPSLSTANALDVVQHLCAGQYDHTWFDCLSSDLSRLSSYGKKFHPLTLAIDAKNIAAMKFLIKHNLLTDQVDLLNRIFEFCDKHPNANFLARLAFQCTNPLAIPEKLADRFAHNPYLTALLVNPPQAFSCYHRLYRACDWGDTSTVKTLLSKYNFLACVFRGTRCSPLAAALRNGHTDIVLMLLQSSQLFYLSGTDHECAQTAIEHGHADTVRMLLREGYLQNPEEIMLSAAKAMNDLDVFLALLEHPHCNVTTVLDSARRSHSHSQDTESSLTSAYDAIFRHSSFQPAYFSLDKLVEFYNDGMHELVKRLVSDPRIAITSDAYDHKLVAAVINARDATMLSHILHTDKLSPADIMPYGEHRLIAECASNKRLFSVVFAHPHNGLVGADTAYMLERAHSLPVIKAILSVHSTLTPKQLRRVLYYLGDEQTTVLLQQDKIRLESNEPETLQELSFGFVIDTDLHPEQCADESYKYPQFLAYMTTTLHVDWNAIDKQKLTHLHSVVAIDHLPLLRQLIALPSLRFPTVNNLLRACMQRVDNHEKQVQTLMLLQQKAHETLSEPELFKLYNSFADGDWETVCHLFATLGYVMCLKIALPYCNTKILTAMKQTLLCCALASEDLDTILLVLEADFSLLDQGGIDGVIDTILNLSSPTDVQLQVLKSLRTHCEKQVWNRRRVQHLCVKIACLRSDQAIIMLLKEQVNLFRHGVSVQSDRHYLQPFQTQINASLFGNSVKAIDKAFIDKLQALCDAFEEIEKDATVTPSC